MSAQVIAFPAGPRQSRQPAHRAEVIEFPPELRVEPLRTLAAEWWYLTSRVNYHKAGGVVAGGRIPISRERANELGDRDKPGPRVSKRYAREIAEAAAFLWERVDGPPGGQHDPTWRDEWMMTWLIVSFDSLGREPSPGLRRVREAIKARARNRKAGRMLRMDGPGAA